MPQHHVLVTSKAIIIIILANIMKRMSGLVVKYADSGVRPLGFRLITSCFMSFTSYLLCICFLILKMEIVISMI